MKFKTRNELAQHVRKGRCEADRILDNIDAKEYTRKHVHRVMREYYRQLIEEWKLSFIDE